MAEEHVDAYGGTIFSGSGDVLTRRPQEAFAQMRAVAPAMGIEGSGVVEELLRWESPVMLVSRIATQDTELGGCPIRAGDKVHPFVGSANTDESEFPEADAIRWGRKANRHIAFGAGVHRCLGSNLARLELRTALRVWHRRIPHYRVKPGTELIYTIGVRSVDSFPMVLGESV